jgi:hypothetical protein
VSLPDVLPEIGFGGKLSTTIPDPISRDWIKVTVAFGHEGTLSFFGRKGIAVDLDTDPDELGALVARTIRAHFEEFNA